MGKVIRITLLRFSWLILIAVLFHFWGIVEISEVLQCDVLLSLLFVTFISSIVNVIFKRLINMMWAD